MQYETIILELLSRIKTLEEDVASIKQQLSEAAPSENASSAESESQTDRAVPPARHQKMSDDMIMICYQCGKKLHEDGNLADLVDYIEHETHMNRNSAIMYLYAVSAMLSGTIYKRAINTRATKMFFDQIFGEYGSQGLKRALKATSLHIEYRKGCGHTVDSIEALYRQYKQRL